MELDNVIKTYGEQPPVHALRGVSLTIRRGEMVGIVGPSGSGKTTLLQLMGTLDQPTRGAIRILGQDVSGMRDRDLAALRASKLGFIFQQFFLAEHNNVLDNVADGLLYAGVGRTERRRRAMTALETVGLDARPTALPTQLSGGQRQRVAIARALVGQPEILLADEPTGNLDQRTGREILDLFEQVHASGTTIVLITHDHDIADRMERRIEVRDGEVLIDTGADIGGGLPRRKDEARS